LAEDGEQSPSPQVVQSVIQSFDENNQSAWALLAEMAAAQFSPRGHPDRERWLMDARRRADEKQLRGVLEIIDRYVA
jgi:hypothetical protein